METIENQSVRNDVDTRPEHRSRLPDRGGANGSSIQVWMLKLSREDFAFVPLKIRHFPLKLDFKPYKENHIGRSAKAGFKAGL